LNSVIEYAEVLYYFMASIAQENRALAMIRLYSAPDHDMLQLSFSAVYSVTEMELNNALQVIDVHTIISVVSVQPHDYKTIPSEQRYFIWEQIGLDIAILRGIQEEMGDNNEAEPLELEVET
jgi:hypothetical protein